MESLLIKYGYFLLFLGVAVEGEAFLLAGAYLAHRGVLHLPTVIVVATGANWAADQIYYLAARHRGRIWLGARFGQHPRYQRLIRLMTQHGNWLLLGSRFAVGFRIIIPAACGALRMPPLRFSILNLLAGVFWAVPTALAGFYFGLATERVCLGVKHLQIYVLTAFVIIGMTILLIRHLRGAEWVEDPQLTDLHRIAPLLIASMGIINLVSAIWPRSQGSLHWVTSWLPLEVTQRSRPLMLFAGLALLQVTRGLGHHKELAWYVATTALSVSLLLHLARGMDVHHSLVAGLLLGYLVYYRRRFYARSDPTSLRRALLVAPFLVVLVFAYGWVGLDHMNNQFSWGGAVEPSREALNAGILIREPHVEPMTPHAARFLDSVQIAGWLARFYLLVLLLRPVMLRHRQEAPAEIVQRIFRVHSDHSISAFAIQDDKHHLILAEGRGLIAYATRGSIALSCGDPLSPIELLETCIQQYVEFCRRNDWTPCFYEICEEYLSVYQSLGLKSLKIAEEAILNLPEFNLAGGTHANLRAMVNKALKAGLVVRPYDRQSSLDPALDEQLEAISQEWLAEKRLGELGFSLGRFSLESFEGIPVFLAIQDGRVEAFCSWLPYRDGQAVVLDLMRKRRRAAAGTMDLLLAHSLLQLQSAGLLEASLANAPLANVAEPHGPLERGVALLFEKMNSFYGYKNLFQFKKKFAPKWQGRYLIYPGNADLPRIAYALAAVHGSAGLLTLLARR
ncbi:MAG: phosphatidylglycerol lysyltransferase domain-containing protein [Acidobacteriota bacterium]